MTAHRLPPVVEMRAALLARDAAYDGIFFTGVRTTGVFCRPTCPAKKPRPEHVEFFRSIRDALSAGFRPCKRCRPVEPEGTPPAWLGHLMRAAEADPSRRWTDADLRRHGMNPDRVRRWFQKHHGMTFHAYGRARRLGLALGQIRHGSGVAAAAFEHGYGSLSGFNEAFRQFLGTAPRDARKSALVTLGRIPTPLGPMVAGATEEALCLLEFADRRMLETQLGRLRTRLNCALVPGNNAVIDRLAGELEAYFSGRLQRFSVPLLAQGTPFQRTVWRRLQQIPFGATTNYAAVARDVGRPKAIRAVARANGDNPVAIIVPCHRVVGSDGQLTGYGGGLWRKQRLLEHEALRAPRAVSPGA